MLDQPKKQHLSFVLVSLVELIHEQEAGVDPRKGARSGIAQYSSTVLFYRSHASNELMRMEFRSNRLGSNLSRQKVSRYFRNLGSA